jgi:hypothetical protein
MGYSLSTDAIWIRGAQGIKLIGSKLSAGAVLATNSAFTITADGDATTSGDIQVLHSQLGGDEDGTLSGYFGYGIFVDGSNHKGNISVKGSWLHGSVTPAQLSGNGTSILAISGSELYTGTTALTPGKIVNTVANINTVALNGNVVGGELGVDTVSSITSSTINLPVSQVNTVLVSADGSGGVATINALSGTQWIGRTVRIVATHANGIVFNTGGNIRAAKTLTAGQSCTATWDGTKWNL